jgi:hypothetical protein
MSNVQLPPFPVDDATLDLLMAAISPREHGGDPAAESSSVGSFLDFMSRMGGSDTDAIEEVLDPGDPDRVGLPGFSAFYGAPIHLMRDPQYHEHNVMAALVEEVRRLRKLVAERQDT